MTLRSWIYIGLVLAIVTGLIYGNPFVKKNNWSYDTSLQEAVSHSPAPIDEKSENYLSENKGWNTCINKEFGYEIRYPVTWYVYRQGGPGYGSELITDLKETRICNGKDIRITKYYPGTEESRTIRTGFSVWSAVLPSENEMPYYVEGDLRPYYESLERAIDLLSSPENKSLGRCYTLDIKEVSGVQALWREEAQNSDCSPTISRTGLIFFNTKQPPLHGTEYRIDFFNMDAETIKQVISDFKFIE